MATHSPVLTVHPIPMRANAPDQPAAHGQLGTTRAFVSPLKSIPVPLRVRTNGTRWYAECILHKRQY
eukprot:gene6336-biopygen7352